MPSPYDALFQGNDPSVTSPYQALFSKSDSTGNGHVLRSGESINNKKTPYEKSKIDSLLNTGNEISDQDKRHLYEASKEGASMIIDESGSALTGGSLVGGGAQLTPEADWRKMFKRESPSNAPLKPIAGGIDFSIPRPGQPPMQSAYAY